MALSGDALKLKEIGNKHFAEGGFAEAHTLYVKAAKLAPDNAVLWGNQAACSLNLRK